MRCEGFRVTPRDREIVRWIGRHRFVTAAQVAERFGVGRSQSYARLTGLVRLGLLRHERLFYGQPGVYSATRMGLDLASVPLPAPTVDLRTYEHDVQLVSLVCALEHAAPPAARVLTERQVRAVDTPGERSAADYRPRFAVQLGDGRQLRLTSLSPPRVHFPDAVVVEQDDRLTAIELERTLKGRARLRRILQAYVAARHIARVRYFTLDPGVGKLVADEVRRLGAESIIETHDWSVGQSALAA